MRLKYPSLSVCCLSYLSLMFVILFGFSFSFKALGIDLNIAVKDEDNLLANVLVGSVLPEAIGEGAFETSISGGSGRYFFPEKLKQCGDEVVSWSLDWAGKHDLMIYLVKASKTRCVVHVAAPDKNGFFRISYSLNESDNEAFGSISFHRVDGRSESLGVTRYPSLNLTALPIEMLDRMKCE